VSLDKRPFDKAPVSSESQVGSITAVVIEVGAAALVPVFEVVATNIEPVTPEVRLAINPE
jgi:hypothetical protein